MKIVDWARLGHDKYQELAAAVWACPVDEMSSSHADTVAEAERDAMARAELLEACKELKRLREACKELLESLGTYNAREDVDIREALRRLDEAKLAARIAIAKAEGTADHVATNF